MGLKLGVWGWWRSTFLSVRNEWVNCREWLDTINSLPPDLKFIEPAVMAKDLVPQLRAQGAEIIIALTHMVHLLSDMN